MQYDNTSLEAAIISAMVTTPKEALPIIFELEIDETIFSEKLWRLLFNTVINLYKHSKEFPDIMLIYDEASASGDFDPVAFSKVSDDIITISHLRTYVIRLKTQVYKRLKRESHQPLSLITATTSDDDYDELTRRHRSLLDQAEHFNPERVDNTQDMIDELKTEAEIVLSGNIPESVIDMSFIDGFHETFAPIERGEYWTIAAGTGIGKTSLVAQIVKQNLIADKMIVIHPLESNAKEFCRSVAAQTARVNYRKLLDYDRKNVDAYLKTLDRLGELINQQIFFYKNNNLDKLTNYNESYFLRHGRPDIIILDYVQLVIAGNPSDTKAARIGEVTQSCKRWAGDFDCCVIGLAQINRDPQKNDRKPTLFDLKESGGIEQDSTRVTFLDMRNKNKAGKEQRYQRIRELTLDEQKTRHGQPAMMQIKFDSHITSFYVPAGDSAKNY